MLSIDSLWPEDEETRNWIALFLWALRTDEDLIFEHAEITQTGAPVFEHAEISQAAAPDKPVGTVIDLAVYRQWKTFNKERTKL